MTTWSLFEEWRDAKALYGWTGPDVNKPRLLPDAEDLAEFVHVTHYEALDRDPDLLWAGIPPDPRGGAEELMEPGTPWSPARSKAVGYHAHRPTAEWPSGKAPDSESGDPRFES